MKFRKTLTSVLISVILVMAVALCVVHFRVATTGMERLRTYLTSFLPQGSSGIEIRIEDVSGTLMRSLRINGIDVSVNGTGVIGIERADLSLNLWQILRIALGRDVSAATLTTTGVSVKLDDASLDDLLEAVKSLKKEDSGSGEDAGGASSRAAAVPAIDLVLSDMALDIDVRGIRTVVSGAVAYAGFGQGLSFTEAGLNIQDLPLSYPKALGDKVLKVSDLRVLFDSTQDLSLSMGSVSLDGMGKAEDISALARMKDDLIFAALYMESLALGGEGSSLPLSAGLESAYVQLSMDRADPLLAFDLSAETLSAKAVTDNLDLDATVTGLGLAGTWNMAESLSVGLGSEAVKAVANGVLVDVSGLEADLGLNIQSGSTAGQIMMAAADVSQTGIPLAGRVNLENLTFDYSLSQQNIGLRTRGRAAVFTDNDLLGKVTTDFELSLQGKEIGNLNLISASVSGLDCASLQDIDATVLLDLSSELSAQVSVSDELSASVVFSREGNQLSVQLFLNDLVPGRHRELYDAFLSDKTFISENTALDGSLILSVAIPESAGISALREGNVSVDVLRSFVDTGRISINAAVRNLPVGKSEMGGGVTLEASFDSGSAVVDTLAVTTMGYRVFYSGTVDFDELVPSGRLSLQSSSDGRELAGVDLSHATGSKTYEYSASSPLLKDVSVSGVIDWQDLGRILINGTVRAGLFVGGSMDFNAVFTPDPLHLSIASEFADLLVTYAESEVSVEGSLVGFGINTGNMPITVSSAIMARYNTESKDFDVKLDGLDVVSTRFRFSSDLRLTQDSLKIGNLGLGLGQLYSRFRGNLDLSFASIQEIISGKTDSLLGTMDFVSESGLTQFNGAVTEDRGYLDILFLGSERFQTEISVLGRRGERFYFSGSSSWGDAGKNSLIFNGVYDNLVFSLYDSHGRLGNLELNDIGLTADFVNNLITGGVGLRNSRIFTDGRNIVQSVVLDFDARADSFIDVAMDMLAGRDYRLDFSVGLSDFQMEDGFTVPDTRVDIVLSNNTFELSGNMINGTFDLKEGYADISVDDGFIFGFKARGYVGSTLDVYISDIHFPLTLANQFIDLPMVTFDKGVIEGELLLKGTSSGPSFYGMLYCQSFDMSMFFLPDQILTTKNLAIALHDRTVSISQAPISGYSENDGRYFHGDLSLEVVILDTGVESMEFGLNINDDTPLDFWFPARGDQLEMEIRTDVSGYLGFATSGGKAKITTDIKVSDMLMDFRIDDELPVWLSNFKFGQGNRSVDMDVRLTTGQDVEFYYPEKDNSFINFTLTEDKSVHLVVADGKTSMDGGLSIKTGQVYYFQNDFIIREGSVDLTERRYTGTTSSFPFVLNLTADLTDYDSDGNKIEISLILKNATPDNITPRFSSVPARDENEIMAMLGQSVLSAGALDQSVSLSSLATLAATATDALVRVGILESNKNYSITGIIRNALGLDIFSARSNILSNVIIDALPGELTGRGDVSILARYLDGTSIYAGKYIGNNWFVKVRMMLKADGSVRLSDRVGHFLAKDLILDNEFSLDFNTPLGTFSVFTQPRELSVFDILDTIGFSVTKQIQF